jgi:MYXO-CTERM domain-containing protein
MLVAGKRWWMAIVLSLVALTWAEAAVARGSVKVSPSTVDENEGTWKLKIEINYGGKPDLGLVPMVFSFTQTAEYERYVDDNSPDTPVERTVPTPGEPPNNVPADVSFSDPATGEMFATTKFTIKLRRDADFEAGEYDLKVTLASGGQIGSVQKIRLKGKNKVQNRKSLSFDAPSPKPSDDTNPKTKAPEEPTGAAEDQGPDLSDIPDSGGGEGEGDDQKVKPKQGGCGCRVAEPSSSGGAAALLALGLVVLGLALARRRRRVVP